MLRIFFMLLILIHGLIHLLGFVKEFGLANVEQLKGKTLIAFSGSSAYAIGILWLLTAILFLLSGILFFIKKDWWWMIGAVTVLLSQSLIILYWQDAKFGTLANFIFLVAIILAYGSWSFNRITKNEISAFLPKTVEANTIITKEMTSSLPPVVQRWLYHSGIIGKEMANTVYLHQKGQMKTTQEGNWMRVEAEQYFTLADPGFIWLADVRANRFIHLYGRDKYQNGRGHMLIKALSIIPVADAKGKEIDQGTMLRFLGESVWFPSFALSKYLKWEEIDSTSAKVTMTYAGASASGVFRFNSNGDLVSFEAKRYYDRKEGATLEDWLVTADPTAYKEFEGVRVPAKLSVTWKLKSGDFTWYKLEVEEVKYNKVGLIKNNG